MPQARLSPRASVAKGSIYAYLRPRLAMDSAVPDLDPIAKAMGKKGYANDQVATLIRQATAGLLAQDADLDDVSEVLETLAPYLNLEKEEADDNTEPNAGFPMAGETEEDGWDRRARDARAKIGRDESEEEKEERERKESAEDARRRMGRDETAEECAKREAAMDARHARDRRRADDARHVRRADDAKRMGRDASEEEREREAEDRRHADDRRARDAKRADDKRRAHDETEEEKKMREAREAEDRRRADDARRADDKRAMDAAIDLRVKEVRDTERAIAAAREDVRPWVGALPVSHAFDSAPAVYKKALDMLGQDVAGVDPSAYRTILKLVPQPGSGTPRRLAMDAALPGGIKPAAERYGTGHIKVMG